MDDQTTPDFYLSVNFPRAIGGRFFSSREEYVASLAKAAEVAPEIETEEELAAEAAPEVDERKTLMQTLKAAGQTVGGNTSLAKLRDMVAKLGA